jgi:hypothetical protein
MFPDADAQAHEVGMDLMRAGEPLAAALVWAELLRGGAATAELYCGLGAALMQSRGQLVRRPFELWAGKVFNRGSARIARSALAETMRRWMEELPEASTQGPLDAGELDAMIDFLQVHERVLPDAVARLGATDRVAAVMVLGDRGDPLYVPLLRYAIEGHLGAEAAKAALARVGKFLRWPEVLASIEALRDSPVGSEIGGTLAAMIDAELWPGWDAPRQGVCPPYRGIGRVEAVLVSAGPRPGDCAELLRAHLGASMRDASSWVRCAPCTLKQGMVRADALALKTALEPAGATLELRNFKWSHEEVPSEVRPDPPAAAAAGERPWWKLW